MFSWRDNLLIPKSRQKLSKKNDIKLVGHTFRLKNYVQIPPPHCFRNFQSWRRHCFTVEGKHFFVERQYQYRRGFFLFWVKVKLHIFETQV